MTKRKKQKTSHLTKGELSQAEIWDDSALIRSWNDAVTEYEYYHSIHARGEDVEEILRKAEMGELDDENTDADVDMGGQWRPVHPETPAEAATAAGAAAAAADENETTADAAAAARDTRSESGEVEDEDGPEGGPVGLEQRRKAAMDQFKSLSDEPDGQQKHPPQSTLERLTTTTTTAPAIGPCLPPTSAIVNEQVPPTATATVTGLSPDQTLENIKMAYYWAGYYSGLYDGQRQRQAQQAQAQAQAQPPAEDVTTDQQ
ncbi:hypothetical protein Z517_05493 [Fonsecaea pedrosoi CBS 271.37]|uniref:Survival Motor Neuron Gemin2-binding domain-containing protein n=1 Tax=Fonsecaea pedrosoi CBS 271.37 TaxID=1442368 RepID=A0A0D2DXG4_9EURO|nr:uncharacterized protein Z517_05493 [Fonsecaea pedrosoi CBS 271.37]KIW82466.1 hypothetical protein Z517_05493 [Fonsecaea pedrosoi CBS 271.37]